MTRARATASAERPCCHQGGQDLYLAPAAQSFENQSFGAIAQLGERYNGIVEVRGSIPLGSTNKDEGLAGDR